jgi:hypothetical protein
MFNCRSALALLFGIATFASAETAFAQREVMVTNNAGVPINVQIGPKSFPNLQPGGVARATLNTTKPPVTCVNTISASGVLTVDANAPNPPQPGTNTDRAVTTQGGQGSNQGGQGAGGSTYRGLPRTGGGGAVNAPRQITVWANPVKTNICSGGRTSFSVTRSGQTLKIN